MGRHLGRWWHRLVDIDARLTEIERRVNLLVNVTPLNAAEAWADFERSDFGTAPTLRLRPWDFDPDLAQRDLVVGGGWVKDAIYLRGRHEPRIAGPPRRHRGRRVRDDSTRQQR